MADVLYLQDEDGDNSDDALDNTSDPDMGAENRDDFLPPLIRIQKYCNSDNIFHRQMVARMVLETLRAVADDPSDVASVISVVNKLADDPEGSVRAELMEQVPHIAMLCHEDKGRLHSLILDHLLPLIVKYLADNDNQVRKTSQAALLVLMEQGLIEQNAVEEKVCPVILMLTEMDSLVEFHTGAVALMSKMAPLIGRSSTERLFLGRFAALCTDPVFYVRKVCAANFGEFCAVVGTDATENVLLPRFVDLCEDEIWGVRKACAETFMSVSCACTLQMRKQSLAPLFANLLVDQSRWVRMSAFQTLGPFISTFADPSITGLSYNQDGELVIMSPEGFEFRCWRGFQREKDLDLVCSMYRRLLSDRASARKAGDQWLKSWPRLNSSQMSENECARFLADVKSCTGNFNRNDNDGSKLDENTSSNDDIEQYDSNKPEIMSDNSEVSSGSYDVELGGSVYNERTLDEKASTNSGERSVENVEEISVNDSSIISESAQRHVELSEFKPVNVIGNENQQLRVSESKGHVHIHIENSPLNGPESFNTFQYWRVPIPELELDISLAETGKPTAVYVKAKVMDEANQRTYASELNVEMEIETELDNLSSRLEDCSLQKTVEEKPVHAQICTSSVSMMTDAGKTGTENKTVIASNVQKSVTWLRSGEVKAKSPVKKTESWGYLGEATEQWEREHQQSESVAAVQTTPQVNQDIVPQQLIDHFVSMTHPSQAHKTDNEIAHHCAYSLPAVALTLGRENWALLKEAYNALASDMQWKVRRTVASSIHELAVILGEDLATKDLVPIFNGFIKDLDEVRIGALKHLAEFLKLLRPQERNSYLPRLSEFMLTDNEWNWRFREELAEQLLEAVNLFSPEDTRKHLTPMAISLLLDKVAAVRQVALSLVTELVRHVSTEPSLLRSLLAELAEWFAHSKRWSRRQTFALLCSHLIVKHILSEELFANDVLPHLLDLSWDPVPNVRLSVARTISTNIMKQEFFCSEGNPHHEVLIQVLKRLQADFDRDVRYFASLCPTTNIEEEPEKVPSGHT